MRCVIWYFGRITVDSQGNYILYRLGTYYQLSLMQVPTDYHTIS